MLHNIISQDAFLLRQWILHLRRPYPTQFPHVIQKHVDVVLPELCDLVPTALHPPIEAIRTLVLRPAIVVPPQKLREVGSYLTSTLVPRRRRAADVAVERRLQALDAHQRPRFAPIAGGRERVAGVVVEEPPQQQHEAPEDVRVLLDGSVLVHVGCDRLEVGTVEDHEPYVRVRLRDGDGGGGEGDGGRGKLRTLETNKCTRLGRQWQKRKKIAGIIPLSPTIHFENVYNKHQNIDISKKTLITHRIRLVERVQVRRVIHRRLAHRDLLHRAAVPPSLPVYAIRTRIVDGPGREAQVLEYHPAATGTGGSAAVAAVVCRRRARAYLPHGVTDLSRVCFGGGWGGGWR